MAVVATLWRCSVSDWIKHHELSRLPLLPANTQACGAATIKKIEACAEELSKMTAEAIPVKKVEAFKVSDLVLPLPNLVPEALLQGKQTFVCGDRVVNCVSGGPVPLGARATVVAVEEPFVDVVLDSKIVSGNTLGGRCSDFRGMVIWLDCLVATALGFRI